MKVLYFCCIKILKITAMKTILTLLGSSFAICVTMIACEKKDQPVADPGSRIDGIIKSYNNAVVLKWDEALSLAVIQFD
jgi:hypothetical protein